MKYYELVEFIMIGFMVLYVSLEVVLNSNNHENDTSNVILKKWSEGNMFFIPFALGAIGGHLFLGTTIESLDINPMIPVIVLFGLSVAMVGCGYFIKFKKSTTFLTILLLAGIAYGHFFWSMNHPI